jgi:5-methylcytosine-specific restriction endonuclease McrA
VTRPGRNDHRFLASRAHLKRTAAAVCAHCGWPIDLQLKWPHPLSWSADHIVPLSQLAPDDFRRWHISNLQPAHLRCNESRGAKPTPTQQRPADLNTSMRW